MTSRPPGRMVCRPGSAHIGLIVCTDVCKRAYAVIPPHSFLDVSRGVHFLSIKEVNNAV